MKKLSWFFGTLTLFFFVIACDKHCTCTDEERSNPCITVNGKSDLPDSLVFIRERSSGFRDSLQMEGSCFAEFIGKQRIRIYENDTLLKSTEWFDIEAADCCSGIPKTVDLDL